MISSENTLLTISIIFFLDIILFTKMIFRFFLLYFNLKELDDISGKRDFVILRRKNSYLNMK